VGSRVTWFVLALFGAVMQAGQFVVVKAWMRHVPPLVLIFWTQTIGVIVWLTYFAISGASFRVPPSAYPWVLASTLLAATMSYLLVRATARGDISIVGPVLATSPVFAILPDYLMSGSLPRGFGWLGIALSVAGTVALSRTPHGRFAPRELFHREDALCTLAASIVLGVLSGVDRRAALDIGVSSYLLALHATMWTGCAILIGLRQRRAFVAALAPARLAPILLHAVFVLAGAVLLMNAITMVPASYVNSVRRMGAVFSVMLGSALFDEPALGDRLRGAVMASAGAMLLLLG
jgi:drug/metabolite transporter (DMT)-like permease